MRVSNKVVLALLLIPGLAFAAASDTTEAPRPCHATSAFNPPSVPWIGDFYYEASVTYREGAVVQASVAAARGTDRKSDELIAENLQQHLRQHYVCDAGAGTTKFFLEVSLRHDLQQTPEHKALSDKDEAARQANASASAAAAAASGIANETLIPLRVDQICTKREYPKMPSVNAVGTLTMSVVFEVIDGKVIAVNAKLKQGSRDSRLNQTFIDAVTTAITQTYVCPGSHVLKQEFAFKLS